MGYAGAATFNGTPGVPGTTLRDFLKKIETTYGKARRVWVMDRGIPSEAILKEMREPEQQTFYLVGTPKPGSSSMRRSGWICHGKAFAPPKEQDPEIWQ